MRYPTMLWQQVLIRAFTLGVVFALSGCLCIGNGDGVGCAPLGTTNGTAGGTTTTSPPAPTVFYDQNPDQTCMISGVTTDYRSQITETQSSSGGTTYTLTDPCSATQVLSPGDLQISSFLKPPLLGYETTIFEYKATAPAAGQALDTLDIAFCTSPTVETRIQTDVTRTVFTAEYAANSFNDSQPAQYSSQGAVLTYQATTFTLTIDTSSSVTEYEYSGTLQTLSGPPQSVSCRVVPLSP